MSIVRVSVPASSANLGPGFDAIGLALELRNELEVESTEEGLGIEVAGEGVGEIPCDDSNLMVQAAWRVFERVGRRPPGLRLHATNRIPLRSGLGSSAAAVVGAIVAANELVEGGLDPFDLLALAHDLEGHADNAAACLFGGLNLVAVGSGRVLARRIPLPPIRVAVAQPTFGLSTRDMREVIPESVPLQDAVFNLTRSLLTVEALRAGDYGLLERVMEDRLHQPYRARFIPAFEAVMVSARRAGAAAVALSGAGPSLVAFAAGGHDRIGEAMVETWKQAGIDARALTLEVAQVGVRKK